jgi:hypothetical protein
MLLKRRIDGGGTGGAGEAAGGALTEEGRRNRRWEEKLTRGPGLAVSERERGGEVGRCGVGGPEGRVGWAASAGTGKRRGKRGSGVLSFFLVFFSKPFLKL